MAAEDWIPDWGFEDGFDDWGDEDGDGFYRSCRASHCNRCGKVALYSWTKIRKAFDGRIKEVWRLTEPNGKLHVCDPSVEAAKVSAMFDDVSNEGKNHE